MPHGILDDYRPMPTVDLSNSEQNGFVQDWLSQFQKEFEEVEDDIDSVIESVQEIYSCEPS